MFHKRNCCSYNNVLIVFKRGCMNKSSLPLTIMLSFLSFSNCIAMEILSAMTTNESVKTQNRQEQPPIPPLPPVPQEKLPLRNTVEGDSSFAEGTIVTKPAEENPAGTALASANLQSSVNGPLTATAQLVTAASKSEGNNPENKGSQIANFFASALTTGKFVGSKFRHYFLGGFILDWLVKKGKISPYIDEPLFKSYPMVTQFITRKIITNAISLALLSNFIFGLYFAYKYFTKEEDPLDEYLINGDEKDDE